MRASTTDDNEAGGDIRRADGMIIAVLVHLFHCDGVRGLEADAPDVIGEAIGILLHDLDALGAVGFES